MDKISSQSQVKKQGMLSLKSLRLWLAAGLLLLTGPACVLVTGTAPAPAAQPTPALVQPSAPTLTIPAPAGQPGGSPPRPDPTAAPTQAAPTEPAALPGAVETGDLVSVPVGIFTPYQLSFDPGIWEPHTNPAAGDPVIAQLQHRGLPGCLIRDNLPSDVPAHWSYSEEQRGLALRTMTVETWTDSRTGAPMLAIYPMTGEIRVEVLPGDRPEECFAAAEEVLVLSAYTLTPSESTEPDWPEGTEIAAVGEGLVMLAYDGDLWEARFDSLPPELGFSDSYMTAYLVHRQTGGCLLAQTPGTGAPPGWKKQAGQENIGGVAYTVTRWTDAGASQPVLVRYQIDDERWIEVWNTGGSAECLDAALDVLDLSAYFIQAPR